MTPGSLPLIVVALVMLLGGGSDIAQVTLLVDGADAVGGVEGDAIVVAGGDVLIEAADVAEVYVVGGRFRAGSATTITRLTQLAGSVVLEDGSVVDELRAYGGELAVEDGASVEHRETLDDATEGGTDAGVVPAILGTLLISAIAARLERRRSDQLANLAHAGTRHPIVSFAVGLTIALTGVALIVFMAFTLVLIPISIAAVAAGVGLVLLGLIGFGQVVGRRIDRLAPPLATAVGTAVTVVALWSIGRVPIVGDAIVLAALTTAIGAGVVSLLGFRRFEPPVLDHRTRVRADTSG